MCPQPPQADTACQRAGAGAEALRQEDLARGYRYQLALRQLELSDTRVFAPPAAARAWFERVLCDQLTLGRPDHVAAVFARKVIGSWRSLEHALDAKIAEADLAA